MKEYLFLKNKIKLELNLNSKIIIFSYKFPMKKNYSNDKKKYFFLPNYPHLQNIKRMFILQ